MGDSNVRDIVEKAHKKNSELRAHKRLDNLSSKRNLNGQDFSHDLNDKEAKTLINICKSGRMSVEELRSLSQGLTSMPSLSSQLLDSEGCLHALTGILSGKDSAKQLLALQCLVNLASHGYKAPKIARAAGAYLVTLLSGTNEPLVELASYCVSNLVLSDRLCAPVLVSQEVVPTLVSLLRQQQGEQVQEAALQALYHLLKEDLLVHLSQDQVRQIVSLTLSLLSSQTCPTPRPPMHLVWLVFSLSSCPSLHHLLSTRSTLNRLLEVATYEIFQKCDSRPLVKLLTPCLRTLANLCAGPESVTTCLTILRHPDLAAILTSLLSTNYLHLCREATWLLANILNNENITVQEEVIHLELMDKLESHAVHAISRIDPYALG